MSETERPADMTHVRSAVTWLFPSRGLVVAAAGSLFAIAGYLSIGGLSDEFGVAIADFAFDRSAYVLFIGLYVMVGLLWVGVMAVAAGLSAHRLERARSARTNLIVGGLGFAAMYLLLFIGRGEVGGVGLVWSLLAMVSTGVWVGSVAAWPSEDAFLRWWVVGVMAVAAVGFVGIALERVSSQGREVADYARALARGETPDEPSSFLGLSVAPSRGLLTVGDETFCVVRISEGVHLLTVEMASEPVRTLIARGDKFIEDPNCQPP